MIDTDKYEGRLADALICVREGGVDDDYSKIRIEDALDDMKDLIAEVKHSRALLAHIARDEGITIVGYDGTRYGDEE